MQEIIKAYQNLFDTHVKENKEGVLGGVKTVFRGDPSMIPASMLPAITIDTDGFTPEHHASGSEKFLTNVTISIVLDEKSAFGSEKLTGDDGGHNVVQLKRKLVEMMNGLDKNCKVSTDSIYGVVRYNPCLRLDGKTVSNDPNGFNVVYEYTEVKGTAMMIGRLTFTSESVFAINYL